MVHTYEHKLLPWLLKVTHCSKYPAEYGTRFEVLTAALMKLLVFWVVTPCLFVNYLVSDKSAASIFRV
jgi:hypothetical protein